MKPTIVITSILGGAGVAVAIMTLAASSDTSHARMPTDSRRFQRLEQAIDDLRADVAQLRRPVTAAESPTSPNRSPATAAAKEAKDSGLGTGGSSALRLAGLKHAKREEVLRFRSLVRKFFDGKASKEDTARFWKLARSGNTLDLAIASAKADVESNPQSVDARMQFAEVNLAKLYTLPRGAERRLWAAQAREQYSAILKMDENNWEARNALATGYFHTPTNLNKTADAIREFEKLRQVQETGAAEKRQAPVYVSLSILYRRVGKEDQARAILEAGLRRHPQDKEITKTLAALQK